MGALTFLSFRECLVLLCVNGNIVTSIPFFSENSHVKTRELNACIHQRLITF